MSEIDVIEILSTYPDCKTNGRKFKAILTDMYPNASKAIVNTLALMSDCGIVDEILSVKQIDLCEESRWKTKLEDDYGISDKIIWECLSLIIQGIGIAAKDNAGERSVENVGCIEADNPIEKKPKASPLSDFEIENGVLVEYKGRSSVVVIPASVTSIGDSAFYDCTGLTNVTIPDSVTSIGESVFEGCSSLTSVTIGNGVTSIGYYAFKGCYNLEDIHITDIETWCKISGLYNLMDYDISNSSKTLYLNNELITSLTIPDSVTSIGNCAFSGCIGLTSITIPDSVTSIGVGAFEDCTGLTSIIIPNSVTSIGDHAFEGCLDLSSVTIGNSVTSIGGSAFRYCTGLTSITIPDSVTSIGDEAFDDTTWYKKKSKGIVYVGKVAYKYKGLMSSNTSITLRDGTLGIADSAFKDCSGLINVTIPDSVTNIDDSAFSCCGGLQSIIIPDSVTSIGSDAFACCRGLTSVIIPDSVTSIKSGVFLGCSGLTNITIPDSVTSIGEDAFRGCKGLTSITYKGTMTQWKAISKDIDWNKDVPSSCTIYCADGFCH